MKKLFAILLTIAMVLPLCTSIAATETQPPTIDEILNDYHTTKFDSTINANISTTSLYSSKSVNEGISAEQETIELLSAAGYDAYYVTPENYLETEMLLESDFETMGLNPAGSYIVVIEPPTQSVNPGARAWDGPEQDFQDPGGSGAYTRYYQGVPYTVRSITVTSTGESDFYLSTTFYFSSISNIDNYSLDILDMTLSLGFDKVAEKFLPNVPVSSILGLIGGWLSSDNLTVMHPSDMVIFAATDWTRKYIQVRNAADTAWYNAHYVSHAYTQARCVGGYVKNTETGVSEYIEGEERTIDTYSAYYDQWELRHDLAIEAYLNRAVSYCSTGDIEFFLISEEGVINFNGNTTPLFYHDEPPFYFFPQYEYDE